jgi:KDO2-lipid IV(A) lauroyltransferase
MKIINLIRYFLEFVIIIIFFFLFKILGLKFSSFISGKIFTFFGPLFRSKKTIIKNFKIAFPNTPIENIKEHSYKMWNYYGRIFAEYPFLSDFRNDKKNKYIQIIGEEILEEIKKNKENVIFVSGHFDNFELMAMYLEKSGITLSAIYRPLNNLFMNRIMENLRKKYICKNQIKKGRSSIRELLNLYKNGSSIALMIDQRVSESSRVNFFNKGAYTTTIPAQFIKKYNCRVVPIHIERIKGVNFQLKIFEPIKFRENQNIEEITVVLNDWLEKVIISNPSKWIWTHDRWK